MDWGLIIKVGFGVSIPVAILFLCWLVLRMKVKETRAVEENKDIKLINKELLRLKKKQDEIRTKYSKKRHRDTY